MAWPLSVSGGSTTTLSHRRLAGAVADDETYVGTICELVHQVHDRACNSAAAVPIVRRALARQDARMRQTIFLGHGSPEMVVLLCAKERQKALLRNEARRIAATGP